MERQDPCGAIININEYRKESSCGWNIDHILPVAKGGTDDIANLRAMHWKNNRSKANDFPVFISVSTCFGQHNVRSDARRYWDEPTLLKLKELYPNNPHINEAIETVSKIKKK